MFERVINFSIHNKLVVGVGVVGLIVWGVVSFRNLPIDAVPDITNNQVQLVTLSPSLAAQEVERLITMPVELTLASIHGISEMRSISRFGLSVVTIVFEDDIDVYWARAQVDQRMIEIQQQVPQSLGNPILAPLTTGLGEIYQYTLRVKPGYEANYDDIKLREIQDWIVRRRLLGTDGVADVSSFGGRLKQIEVSVDPERLRTMGLTMSDLMSAMAKNNQNAGGAYIEKGPQMYYIRTEGLVQTIDDVARIAVKTTTAGTPVLMRDVATVRIGNAVRYGAMTMDDIGETVGGIVMMLKGANSSKVIDEVKTRMTEIGKTLPEGIEIMPFLDRTKLVNKAISTVSTNLIEGALIVIFVLVLLLGNVRAGLIVASVIPLSMLFALGLMSVFGVSGNLMSLGAIDFGLIVDGAVIIVENVLHVLERRRSATRASDAEVGAAALSIRRSSAFGEIIIMMVYLPILALVGIEGKMFRPMAQTVMFAIAGAFLLSTTYVPMMCALLLKQVRPHGLTLSDRIMNFFQSQYAPVRHLAMRYKGVILAASALAFVGSALLFLSMGGEFIPQLDEGDFAVETRLMTGSSLSATINTATQAASLLKANFPEVERVVGKIGTSEIPLDPMPMEACDLIIVLKDKKEWTSAHSREELASKMQALLSTLPGVTFGFQQPIQMRFNELMTGARQDVVIKIFGDDMDTLASKAAAVADMVSKVEGAQDVYLEQVSGLPQVVVRVNREACSRLGVNVNDVNTTVEAAFAGKSAGLMYENERRFDIVVRMDSTMRHEPSDLGRLFVPTMNGAQVPISQVASINIVVGPNQIQREDTKRRITVGFNVRGRDVQSIVDEITGKIDARVQLPSGYYATYGGQFENLNAAKDRLMVALPAALLLIFFLLYITFRSLTQSALIFTAIPLSAIGGVVALSIRGMPFSISAGIGFIALFGVAVLNGIVLIGQFNTFRAEGMVNIHRIIFMGTTARLRPVVMTAMVASLGFLPMALSTGDGAEVQRPLATVVIGGLITSTLLTLIVLPILYYFVEHLQTKRAERARVAAFIILMMILVGVPAQAQHVITREEAVQRAMQTNRTVRLSRSSVAQLDALQGAAVDLGKTTVQYMGGQYNSVNYDNNFSIGQTIPFPTILASQHALATARTDEARAQSVLTERQIRADVERAYERIVMLRAHRGILAEQEALLDSSASVARLRERVGETPMMPRVSTETQRAEVRMQGKQLEQDIRSANNDLRLLITSDSLVTTADSTLSPFAPPTDTTLAAPIIGLLEKQVQVAEEAKSVETSRYWPDISLGYFNQSLIGIQNINGVDQFYGSGARFQGFTVGLHVPLWFGPVAARSHQADLQQQFVREQQSVETWSLKERIRQRRAEVVSLFEMTQFYLNRALPDIALLAQQSLRAYQAGEIGYIEHQFALLRSLSVRQNAIDAIYRYNLVVIELQTLVN